MFTKLLKWVSLFLFVILILGVIFFTFYNPNLYPEDVKAEIEQIVVSKTEEVDSSFLCGWFETPIIPPFPTPIAIDAERGGAYFEGVRDSVFARVFVFKKGFTKVAWVQLDLLITPPEVLSILDRKCKKVNWDSKNLFFSASHTHSSIGGWQRGIVGEIFAGKYNQIVPEYLSDQILKTLSEAEKRCRKSSINYFKIKTDSLVINRLVGDSGTTDPYIRGLCISNDRGESALISGFSAHSTVLHENNMKLSNDWPGGFIKAERTKKKWDIVGYFAGAVGSMGPFKYSDNQEEQLSYLSSRYSKYIETTNENIDSAKLDYIQLYKIKPFYQNSNLRVSESFALRDFWFKKLFGKESNHISILNISKITIVGFPCDFSGEYMSELETIFEDRNVIVSCFNGGYIGYVCNHEHENLNSYETRTMNWFGPGLGIHYLSTLKKFNQFLEKNTLHIRKN